jgi:hypothetical protein
VHRIGTVVGCIIDVLPHGPDIGADLCVQTGFRDEPERLALPLRCGRRSDFDDVYADGGKLLGDFEFLSRFQRDAGSLFPVP